MVTIDRHLGGILPYRMVFFPTDKALDELAGRLRAPGLARLFWTTTELEAARRVVRHQRTATVCIALTRALNDIGKAIAKNCRYDIRQMEKMAQRFRIVKNAPQGADDFLDLYNSFARSKGEISPISRQMLKRYEKHADIFLASFDGLPLCGHVLLRDEIIGRTRLLFSASRRLEDRQTARVCGLLNRFLHWHEIQVYRDEGFRTYDFGGIRDDQRDGITQFKMSFGGDIVAEHTYLCAGNPQFGRAALWLSAIIAMRRRRARLKSLVAV